MARRKKPEDSGGGDLLAGDHLKSADLPDLPRDNSQPTPKLLEYRPLASTENWHVENFEEFAVEFGMTNFNQGQSLEVQMTHFHELGVQNRRPWLICRRLFGIGPMIPPADAQPDDLRPLTRTEICQQLGLQSDELKAELDSLRSLWNAQQTSQERAAGPPEETVPEKPKAELDLGDELLAEFGFDESMFNVVTYNHLTKSDERRSSEANRIERNWFCRRVKEWAKMLAEPVAGAVAREALLNELYLRRFGQEMAMLGPSSKKWEDLYKSKKQIEEVYQQQISSLQELFPEIAIANKTGLRAVLSDLTKAHQEYYGRKDRVLIDHVNTAYEIEVLTRQSAQAPEPRYRWGLNMAIIEAIHNLYDPDFRPQFKMSVLKKLDAGFKEGMTRMRESLNEPLVDLENGVLPGEGDDFEDLKEPEPQTNQPKDSKK